MPIAYLLALPSFQSLTACVDDIVNAALESTVLDVSSDKTSIRFAIPVERKTIIVRDTPKDVKEEDVRSILEGFPITGLKQEVGSSWFITFPDEATALAALSYLHSQRLHDQPVKARVKSEFYRKALGEPHEGVRGEPAQAKALRRRRALHHAREFNRLCVGWHWSAERLRVGVVRGGDA